MDLTHTAAVVTNRAPIELRAYSKKDDFPGRAGDIKRRFKPPPRFYFSISR